MIILGMYGYRKLTGFYKWFFLQALLAVVLYAMVASSFRAYNHVWFNLYIVVEFVILMCAAGTLLHRRTERWLITGGLVLFLLVFALDLILQGSTRLANHAAAVGAVPVLVAYFVIMYRSANRMLDRSVLWLCLGLILYFCGNAPFLAMMQFIQSRYSELSFTLQTSILEPLGHLRYLLAALSFWLFLRNYTHDKTRESAWRSLM
jgi:hypothetical protein